MTILVAEDDKVLRDSLAKFLSHYFREVVTAEDGVYAMEKFTQNPVHVVMLDIVMPRMNGLEVASNIRKHDPDIPILILTAHSEKEHLLSAVRLRLMEYLVKPVKMDALKSALAACVVEMRQRGRLDIQLEGGARYNAISQKIHLNGSEIALTRNEKLFMEYMLGHRGQVISADCICQFISPDPNDEITLNGLRNLVYRLRGKIGNEAIICHKESGYMIP
ncbi:response regulator transcription factor [Desulfurispira natronophila]|uniref:DNA-binding response OmpR family regulator n=1 Tax=Desulfurispira natronophila TaxID=682562 RepID=A0A7W7Y301_9BACT|nr:response regulator transcription factor [Desulfurispira natronophila]MBB5021155.1 DNA-binding response OmpR family regulator [Desulfurispira natronophila]